MGKNDGKGRQDDDLKHRPLEALAELKARQKAEREAATDAERARRRAEKERAELRKHQRARDRRRGRAQSAAPGPTDDAPPDDRSLFEAALENVDDADLFEVKFGSVEDPASRRRHARKAQTHKAPPRDEAARTFEQEMAKLGVERMPDEKKRVPKSLPRRSISRENVGEVRKAHEDPEASVQIDGGERKLIDRARRQERREGPLPMLTVRGLHADQALDRLRSFVAAHHGRSRYVRVITGKGKQSSGAPVLKHRCRDWLETRGEVALIARELNRDGDYGSLIVQLKRRG